MVLRSPIFDACMPAHQTGMQGPWTLGLNTGAGKPAVFPKRVWRVQVRFSFLAHRGTPLPVPRYCGYVRVNPNKVILIFTVFFFLFFFQCFFSKFITSRRDETKYGTVSRTHTFASYHQPTLSFTPTPIQLQKQCK
jgi:hypothetical protein